MIGSRRLQVLFHSTDAIHAFIHWLSSLHYYHGLACATSSWYLGQIFKGIAEPSRKKLYLFKQTSLKTLTGANSLLILLHGIGLPGCPSPLSSKRRTEHIWHRHFLISSRDAKYYSTYHLILKARWIFVGSSGNCGKYLKYKISRRPACRLDHWTVETNLEGSDSFDQRCPPNVSLDVQFFNIV